MVDMKCQIELKLIAVQISDWCKHREGIIFRPSLCTQERCIRFTTKNLQDIFPEMKSSTSNWENDVFLIYEIYNDVDSFKIAISVNYRGLTRKQKEECKELLNSVGIQHVQRKSKYLLKEWDYSYAAMNISKITQVLADFLDIELPYFENELLKWKKNHKYMLKPFPEISLDIVEKEELPDRLLIEGGMKEILTNQYERNVTAKKKCIAVHGTTCAICGFDFGVVYGSQFIGKIEVHHKIPLFMIKKDYVVDPVEDLIPVCSNCHMILHSKPDGGYYTVDEVKKMIDKQKH